MKRLLSVLFACALCAAFAPAQKPEDTRSSLRVLFVGHDPQAPRVSFPQLATERTWRLHYERTASFEALLRYHFQHVSIVYGDQYRVSMSDNVDVTIFDTRPRVLREMVNEVDPETGERNYRPASYLPASFNRPALCISENSSRIGEPLGSKLDWL